MNDVKEKLDLDKIPHLTIFQKFVPIASSSLFYLISSRILKLFYSHGENVYITAIDTSRRIGNLRRSFLKTSISLDTKKKVIFGWKVAQKMDHKIKHANVLIRQ